MDPLVVIDPASAGHLPTKRPGRKPGQRNKPLPSDGLLMSVRDAAGLLGVSVATAYAMAATGALPTVQCGVKRLLVSKKAFVEKFGAAA